MKLIELHYNGMPFSLRVDYIAAVNTVEFRDGCEVFMVGEGQPWNPDESYEEVLRMIQEVSNETG